MSRLNANEIQVPYDKDHKLSSLVKRHQNTQFWQIWSSMKMSDKPVKHEVLLKMLDISARFRPKSVISLFQT